MNPDSEGSQDYFVNKKTGSRTSRLTAKKMPDGSWETMEALKDRLRDTWNVDEVECTYDEKGNCVTSPASQGKKAKRNRKSKERRKAKAAANSESEAEPEHTPDASKETDEIEALEADPRPLVDEPKEEKSEPMGKAIIEAAGFTKTEGDAIDNVDASKPVPSEDGERLYELSGTTASNIKSLTELFDTWAWDDGIEALKDKVVEEANELKDGGNEKPVMDGKNLKVVGTSAASECLTVIICALKLLHMQDIDVNTAIRALYPRHLEQYERYKHLQDKPGSDDLGKAETV